MPATPTSLSVSVTQQLKCLELVVCRSEYFDKLRGTRSRFAESTQDSIELPGDDPNTAKAIVKYMYTGRYHERDDERDDIRKDD